MAGKTIKGITVEIGGDTTKLGDALKKVNSQTTALQKELKGVNTLLKSDPSNVTLLTQKQELLTKAITETESKLGTLKTAQEQVQKQFEKGDITAEQYRDFQREIIATEQKLESLEKEAKKFGSVFKQQCEAASEKIKEFGGKIEDTGKKMLPATAAVSAIGVASVKTAADFEAGMSKVSAVSGATGNDLERLRAKAIEMGDKTKFSASESAAAFNYMAMAGWKTEEMLAGIDGIMALSAADGLDLATTSDIVTDGLTAFGLAADEAGHFADVLAQGSRNANLNVSMLGEAFKYVGPVAGSLGYSIEDVTKALGLMANVGIKSSQAGTSLRQALASLISPTDSAAAVMEAYNVSLFDNEGNAKDLMTVMQDLRGSFGNVSVDMEKVTEAAEAGDEAWSTYADSLPISEQEKLYSLTEMFGVRAMPAMLAVINATEKDFNSLSDAIDHSKDTAQNMADTMLDNLSGQITILKSNLQTLAISIADILMPSIKSIVSMVQGIVGWLNSLSDTQKKLVVTILGIVAAIGPLLIIIGKFASAISSIIEILPHVKTAISAITGVMGSLNLAFLTSPFFWIPAAIAAVVAAFVILYKKCDWFREAVDKVWAKIKEGFQAVLEWFKSIPEKISAFFSSVVNFFKENWQGLLLLIVNPFAGAFKLLYDNCEGFRETINNLVEKIKLFFTETIPEAIKTVIQWFADLPYNIGVAIGLMIGHIANFAKNAWDFFTIKLPSYITIAVDWFKTLPNKIWNAIVSAIEKIATWCSNMKSKAQTGITNLINSVMSWFKSLPGKISSAISNGVTIISTWCSNMKNKAVSGVKNVANAVVNGFKSLPNKMLNIGKNIVEGIWNGIKNAKNWIIGKVKDFAQGILDGMKSALGIHSPSRVFRDEIGKYISQGIGVGITENQNAPIEALEDVGNNMLNSTKGINGLTLNRQIENTFKSNVSTDSAVLGLLNDILNKLDKNTQIVLDSGKLVGETAPAYDAAFGAMRTQTSRGW